MTVKIQNSPILLNNHCGANGSRTRVQSYSSSYLNYTKIYLIVGASGFEPKMTAPKTVVLPLHHAPMNCVRYSTPMELPNGLLSDSRRFAT